MLNLPELRVQRMLGKMTRIYTRAGDAGITSFADGKRAPKDHPRTAVIGDIDELNSAIGAALAFASTPASAMLEPIQHHLFWIGAEIAIAREKSVTAEHVAHMERAIDAVAAGLDEQHTFFLPRGTRASALLHLARAVCRRTERNMTALSREEHPRADILRYLNRLSDLLHVLARAENRRADENAPAYQAQD